MKPIHRIGVVGAGAFGTALAVVACSAGREATLWARDRAQIAAMRSARENVKHLPGIALPAAIAPTADLADIRRCEAVLLAVPAQSLRAAAGALAASLRPGIPVVSCSKGIERQSGKLPAEILAECLPGAAVAALSGPGFADEIARGLPTAVTVASADIALAETLCLALSSETFRPYASDDLVGVEIAGATKNVLAIACGIAVGRGLGESARAALISRGLAEMTRLGVALGGRRETFGGLAGLGDLVLTATSARSRNMSFGLALGQGRSVAELTGPDAPLAEGVHTARIAADLAIRHRVEAPIITAVAAILDGTAEVDASMRALLARPLKREADQAWLAGQVRRRSDDP
jgi:glycerol-3-phosphate dehydrogenase (NAD(P)+)